MFHTDCSLPTHGLKQCASPGHVEVNPAVEVDDRLINHCYFTMDGDVAMYSPLFKRFIYLLPILFSFLFVSLHAQPKSRRSDITIKQLGVVGNNTVRIKRDPVFRNGFILSRTTALSNESILEREALPLLRLSINHPLIA